MEYEVMSAIQSAMAGKRVFCKFLSANDTGKTGAHQAGIYISKPSVPILFDEPGIRGENKEKRVTIAWQDGRRTDSRFIYYGQGTRNEYRITNFGRSFPYLRSEFTGALFILVQKSSEDYDGFVLNAEDDINQFLDTFGISVTQTNQLLNLHHVTLASMEKAEMERLIETLDVDFPSSERMSMAAREIDNRVYDHVDYIVTNPDKKLIDWTNMEFKLFQALEYARYGDVISKGFLSMEDFVMTANQVLNRRKSRAGKSLEHHLAALFSGNGLIYEEQVVTEGNKKPDFLFPSQAAYHTPDFPTEKLISLAAKTTCKDRWRQVINEADRLRQRVKYLCTLQQGISTAQIDEMKAEQIVLVVPKPYISYYPKERQDQIWTISQFIRFVKETEGIL